VSAWTNFRDSELCGGAAYCSYRSRHQKSQKHYKMKKSELALTLEG